jgi:pimeloyl-ACP methyl ester carboxylesterase
MNRSVPRSVLIVHGLWMNRLAMSYLAHLLEKDGFCASAVGYRSMREELKDHVQRVRRQVTAISGDTVDLVGHSLGGLILLRYLQEQPDERVRRVVLLGSPVSGCRAAAGLAVRPGARLLLGRSLSTWRLPFDCSVDPRREVGVIAGTRPVGLGQFLAPLTSPHDGVVCVDETRFAGMRDHLLVPVCHSEMLVSRVVARQTGAFLKHGAFSR